MVGHSSLNPNGIDKASIGGEDVAILDRVTEDTVEGEDVSRGGGDVDGGGGDVGRDDKESGWSCCLERYLSPMTVSSFTNLASIENLANAESIDEHQLSL